MIASAVTLDYAPYAPTIELPTTQVAVLKRAVPGHGSREAVATAGEYVTIGRDSEFGHHFAKLKAIQTDQMLWPYGAEGPRQEAIFWASQVLSRLEDDMMRPSRIVASADGGVAVCFVKGDLYAHIECFNDGMILGAASNQVDR